MAGDRLSSAFGRGLQLLNPTTLIERVQERTRGGPARSGSRRGGHPSDTEEGQEQAQPRFDPTHADVSDEELLRSVPDEFYQEHCDPVLYALEHLPERLTRDALEREVVNRERAMELIDSKLSGVIMDNYKSFVQGMARVQDFEADLVATTTLLRKGRIHLANAKSGLTGGGMQIVEKARKNQLLTRLYDDTAGVKQIITNGQLMDAALAEADFPLAIELCLRCRQDAEKYKLFQSANMLGAKFTATYDAIDDRLEASLAEVCRKFNPQVYEKTLVGFKLIAKHSQVIEVMQKCFSDSVDVISYDVVLGFAMSSIAGDPKARPDRLKSKPFKELCMMLREDVEFVPCLRVLMEQQCNLMLSLYAIIRWHRNAVAVGESNSYFADIEAKLVRSRKNLWEDIQRKTGACLSAKALNGFKFDDFLTVLNLINKFINIGDAFTGQQSPILRSTVRSQAEAYFATSHRSRMEDLRTMLENEAWFPCPLQPDFSLQTLREFDFSKNIALAASLAETGADAAGAGAGGADTELFEQMLQRGGFSFAEEEVVQPVAGTGKRSKLIKQSGNVADAADSSAADAGRDDDSDDDEPEELKRDFVDEGADASPAKKGADGSAGAGARKAGGVWRDDETVNATVRARRRAKQAVQTGGPILASTTVNVVRMIGRYISMAQVLSPIAYEILAGMTQIVEFYLYAVFKFFATDVRSANELLSGIDPALGARLRTTLLRLRERYDEKPADAAAANAAAAAAAAQQQQNGFRPQESVLDHKYTMAKMSTMVELKNPNQLFGLNNRVTANESILYLDKVLRSCREKLESLIPSGRGAFLSQFYSQTIDTINDLRMYIYRCIARRLINMEVVAVAVGKVDWDMKDVGTNTSPYVQNLVLEFLQFKTRLDADPTLKNLPADVQEILWRLVITHAIESLADAFSTRVKKFSNEGRAQMQIDFQSFIKGLQELTSLKQIPHQGFMDSYIKAYYIPEKDFDKWFSDHKSEFTPTQLKSVVNTNIHLLKNAALRKQYLKTIEELERTPARR